VVLLNAMLGVRLLAFCPSRSRNSANLNARKLMPTENALGYLLGVLKEALIKRGARVFKMAAQSRSHQGY